MTFPLVDQPTNSPPAQDGPSVIPSEEAKPAQVKIRRKRQPRPTPQFLASMGVKVRDFAYESKLPPVKTVYRQPKQIQPSSQPAGKALERTVTEPVLDLESQDAAAAANVATHVMPPIPETRMDIEAPARPRLSAKPLSRAIQPGGMFMRAITPVPQAIPMVPTPPAEQVAPVTPIHSPEPVVRPRTSSRLPLTRSSSRQNLEPKGRRAAFIRSPYALRKRSAPAAVTEPTPPPKRRRLAAQEKESVGTRASTRNKTTAVRRSGRKK